jgi:hypothetical protein
MAKTRAMAGQEFASKPLNIKNADLAYWFVYTQQQEHDTTKGPAA